MKKISVIILLLFPILTKAQIISTIAGNGIQDTIGIGGLASAASLYSPVLITLDDSGNYFFLEGHNYIMKIDRFGILTRFAGNGLTGGDGDGGPAINASLAVNGIAVDDSGIVYISDFLSMSIRKINAAGIILKFADLSWYGHPKGIAIDKSGNIYACLYDGHNVVKISNSGIISEFAGIAWALRPHVSCHPGGDGGPATAAEFCDPEVLVADRFGNVYIGDVALNTVKKVDTFGIITNFAGNGNPGYTGDGGPATDAELIIGGLAVDFLGDVYISDGLDVRVVLTDGIITTYAGNGTPGFSGDGGYAALAQLDSPWSIAVSNNGNLYICDAGNNRIRQVTASTSVKNNNKSNGFISLHPNPAATSLTISSSNKISQITITNLLGQVLFSNNYNAQKAEINIAFAPASGCAANVLRFNNTLRIREYQLKDMTACFYIPSQ